MEEWGVIPQKATYVFRITLSPTPPVVTNLSVNKGSGVMTSNAMLLMGFLRLSLY
jgi:hypothetical protein